MPATSERVFVGTSDRVAEGGRFVVDVGEKTVGIFRVEGKLTGQYDKPRAYTRLPVVS